MSNYRLKISDPLILQTTRALTKFIRDHGGIQLPFMERMLASLEAKEFDDVAKQFKLVHFGAYGIGDWFPPVVFDCENEDYAQVVFDALIERWGRLMNAATERTT